MDQTTDQINTVYGLKSLSVLESVTFLFFIRMFGLALFIDRDRRLAGNRVRESERESERDFEREIEGGNDIGRMI